MVSGALLGNIRSSKADKKFRAEVILIIWEFVHLEDMDDV